jgi:hypothetical protein
MNTVYNWFYFSAQWMCERNDVLYSVNRNKPLGEVRDESWDIQEWVN